eukprot:TRINITY_DN2991_c1_g2_i2.p1 TRINITY_DN2991_c1_g2~~TRINITY_DN2991_c1_g2_i2.p1  ORF type:complete len:430 (+),score=107.54 TRINITY_DN2991_c1_g2_i2:71-1360(+)
MKTALLLLAGSAVVSGKYSLGKAGESCDVVCNSQGLKCNPKIVTNNNTDLFSGLGINCAKPPTHNGTWYSSNQPGYVSDPTDPNYGECLGYKGVPDYDNCNSAYSTVQRLCNCEGDNTYRNHFGTGLSSWELPAKETTVFAHSLPAGSVGSITHIWTTCSQSCVDGTVIRFYIDGETTPSIDMLPPMAAGVGFNDSHAPWGTKWMGLGAGNGGNGQAWFNNFRIPFTKSIRVTLHHQSGAPFGGFYFIVRGARDMPIQVGGYTLPKTAKLLLQKFEGELQPLEWLAVTDVKSGSGIHFASTIAVASNDLNFLEGCYHSFSPYNESFPGVLLSTGTEDYFDSGWYFNAGTFRFPVSGNTHLVSGNGKVTWSAYRMHDQDPLFFNDGLRVLWRNGDVLDPTMKTKCYTQKGITVGNPTVSTVVSYAWVYVW